MSGIIITIFILIVTQSNKPLYERTPRQLPRLCINIYHACMVGGGYNNLKLYGVLVIEGSSQFCEF